MKTSIATVSLSGMLPSKLTAIAAAGFDGFELFENDLLYFDGAPGTVRSMACDLGLEIYLYQPFRDFEGVSAAQLQQNLERARRKFDVMHALGVGTMLVCSNVSPQVIRDDALAIDQLGALAELARQSDVRIAYEALAWGAYVNSYKHAWHLVQAVGSPYLGLGLDSFHTLSIGDDLDMLAQIPGDKLAFMQVADAPVRKMDVLEWSRHYRCLPGQGELDVTGFVATALAAGYCGPLSLEIFNDGFRAAPAELTARDGLRSLRFLESQARDALASAANTEAAGTLAPLPPAPASADLQFLEFAVDANASATLTTWLEKLGFLRMGRHRSKDVTLFQHGRASIILNAEPDSFASAFFMHHGVSLCASAFRIDSPQEAAMRATKLGYALYEGRVGPNERNVPAVLAPDSSLFYLVDELPDAPTLYESDFHLTDFDGPTEAGPIVGVDHVTLSVPGDTLDSWVLFFRAAFGFVAEHSVVLHDPFGQIQSKAIRSRDGTVRIVLNASVDPRTIHSETISAYKGSGLSHVAFRTTDIAFAIRRLEDDGVPMLRIAQSYYNDIAARFNLDDAFVNVLRKHNILYDRDVNGEEFLHAYTEQVDHRFFFELVERRGAYDGYGAPNAAVRLAAQATHRG
ncbi:4-hydroxymandelate synthase [Pandoraea terrae]|uniref:3-dehydroshikimate dehydratase n=1 Tax=Pandoraea terrae TaxID=1537710 RepID=A0A5E4SFQ3_9BURK|nr:sugar phosphate isomerase/epimerase and 4-hydroxyphenylpyruvate domain-containing protein [Pandoraea terrae]VVD72998.1 4-hydroxymandelate synthase [Pandoraea terrae]